ncbi:virulence factor family protein [Ferirhizobium litorale]
MSRIAAIAAALTMACSPAAAQAPPKFDAGLIPSPKIMLPSSPANAVVVLISDEGGWSGQDQTSANTLVEGGAAVIGIDLPDYVAALADDKNDCIYLVGDIESLSQQLQRASKSTVYRHPVVAGIGSGGALALAIASQTPAATIGATVAIDPKADVKLPKMLCTPAVKENTPNGVIYGLPEGTLPDTVIIGFTPNADARGHAHAEQLKHQHEDIEIRDSDDDARTMLDDALSEVVTPVDPDNPLDLPIAVLDASPTRNTMAVIYSGDGGWRDLDKVIGGMLQDKGIPVIGVDSLRYFWSGRTPQETADDLARIIDVYRERWKVRDVMLIGYSFGADTLPATYRLLPEADKSRVVLLSLLGMSHSADFRISVFGLLGAKSKGTEGDPVDDVKGINPALVQCIYGVDDDDACADLKDLGVETIAMPGGHHFDGDYDALAGHILDALDKRLASR